MNTGVRAWAVVVLSGFVACSGAPKPCTPGVTLECLGSARCEGAQVCLPDGTGYGPCDCGDVTGGRDGGPIEPGPDAGVPLGAPCSKTMQCSLSHVCVDGRCLEVDGGIGAFCDPLGRCLPGHLCLADALEDLDPICLGECVDSTTCPGGYSCQVVNPSTRLCVPPGVAGACRNTRLDGGLDRRRDCKNLGWYCKPAPENPAVGTCVEGDCTYSQPFCDEGSSCRPVGAFGWDNTGGALCVANGDGGSGAPCNSVFQCAGGFGCKLNAEGSGTCLKFCAPGSPASVSCAGLRRRFADGGYGGPASCVDLFKDRSGTAISGANAINSTALGYCD